MHDLSYFRNQSRRHRGASGRRAASHSILKLSASSMRSAARRLPKSEQLKAQRNDRIQEIGKLKQSRVRTRPNRQQKVREMGDRISALDEQRQRAGREVSPAAGRHSQYSARVGATGKQRRRQRRSAPLGQAAGVRFRAQAALGSGPGTWAFSISNAPLKSPARDSPSIGDWARSWSAR